MIVLRVLRAVGAFWIDFLVGDDWTVAATVAVALGATWVLVGAGIAAWWLLPAAVLAATTYSLRRTARRAAAARSADAAGRGS